MSNKTNLRRAALNRKKEESFNLNQSLREMIIPEYNALRDPFLNGFFQHPNIIRHLKSTGVVQKSRKLSLKTYRQVLTQSDKPKILEETNKQRKSKSQTKKTKDQMKFPNLSLQMQRRNLQSQGGNRVSCVIKKSTNHPRS